MSLFLILIVSVTNLNSLEPEVGYWVCDVMRQETNVDFVVLQNSVFIDSLSYKTDTLVTAQISMKELIQIVNQNSSITNLIPISGFSVIFDSTNNLTIIVSQPKKEPYLMLTTQNIQGINNIKNNKSIKRFNQIIPDIIENYLISGNQIKYPVLNRYLYSGNNQSISENKLLRENNSLTKININNATLKELISLPGIGPKIAKKIINYRAEKGLFTSIKDIMNVKGIGPKKFEQLKYLITL
jgi:competence protein ComEA